MDKTISEVLNSEKRCAVVQSDSLDFLKSLPDDSVDLFLCSPPYQRARLYLESGKDMGIARNTETWVAWLIEVAVEARRVCKGLCVFIVEGQTKNYRYSAGPLLFAADLHRKGFHLRKPPIYRRVGIPGSGGPDWWRNDYEYAICFTQGGKLPWSDNTATGHPPKWAPGGAMSHRLSDGQRVNQWGKCGTKEGVNGVAHRRRDGERQQASRPSHIMQTKADEDPEPVLFEGAESGEPTPKTMGEHEFARKGNRRAVDGTREKMGQKPGRKVITREREGQHSQESTSYQEPILANPGNVMEETYTAEDIAAIIGEPTDIIDCKVGGGLMGSKLAHENEAPFPEALVEPFIRCFCPPDGIVCDPFSGSGTTLAVAIRWGRRAIACDLRQSQVEISQRRAAEFSASLFDAL